MTNDSPMQRPSYGPVPPSRPSRWRRASSLRFRGPKRLFVDDWLIMFAWLLCGLSAIAWQVISPPLYTFLDVSSGHLWPPPAAFAEDAIKSWRGQLIVTVFFNTSLFTVKLSFLAFFRRLRRNVAECHYLWWGALFLTVSTYLVWIGTTNYPCMTKSMERIVIDCSTISSVRYTEAIIKAGCALDIVSDFFSKSHEVSYLLSKI
ncbi:hypothetical protein PG997_007228 [Apiospora hydei]|uniref:Rhodopsin domain-containing protein n=1 Tax=Apiospora hydei TaxID=1337664 RepID=A0ABR1W7E6_9PEZI